MRVLTIDEDINIQKLLKLELEDEGYKVEQAYDGLERLEKLEEAFIFEQHHPYDVITLDILMLCLGGFKTLRMIKERYPNISVILDFGHYFSHLFYSS